MYAKYQSIENVDWLTPVHGYFVAHPSCMDFIVLPSIFGKSEIEWHFNMLIIATILMFQF